MSSTEMWPLHQFVNKSAKVPYANMKDTPFFKKHQRVVAKFLSPHSPYRGLLVYHGLGSGKTRAAIATILEHFGSDSKIIIILPASLHGNFNKQIKELFTEMIEAGAIDGDINLFISKMIFYHYNGLTKDKISAFKEEIKDIRPCLIVIDEVHNFVHQCLKPQSVAFPVYDAICKADNLKICALSGTPCINNPYELSKLMNMLRGPIAIRQTRYSDDQYEKIQKLYNEDKILFHENNLRTKRGERNLFIEWQEIPEDYKFVRGKYSLVFNEGTKNNHLDSQISNFQAFGDESTPYSRENFYEDFVFRSRSGDGIKNQALFQARSMGLVSVYDTPTSEYIHYPKYVDASYSRASLDHYYANIIDFFEGKKAKRAFYVEDEISSSEVFIALFLKICGYKNERIDFNSTFLNLLDDNRENIKMHNDIAGFEKLSDRYTGYLKHPQTYIHRADFNKKIKILLQCYMFGVITFNQTFERSNGDFWITRMEQFLGMCGLYMLDIENKIHTSIKRTKKCFEAVRRCATSVRELESVAEIIGNDDEWASWFGNTNFEFKILDDIPYQTYYLSFSPNHLDAYDRARSIEKESETKRKRRNMREDDQPVGSYREKSRTLCNFYNSEATLVSPKFDMILRIIKFQKQKAIIYSSFKTSSIGGIYKLAELLRERLNFEEYTAPTDKKNMKRIPNLEAKLRYAIFTSDVDMDQRAHIEKVFNLDNNKYGNTIQILLMTQSGAEGVNFKCVRQVHILEPHWNLVRLTQVCGRARRMHSHALLEKSERNISVFLYLMSFRCTSQDAKSKLSDLIRTQDGMQSTDEYLLQLSANKEKLNHQFQYALKQIAIDRGFYDKEKIEKVFIPPIRSKFVYLHSYNTHVDEFISTKDSDMIRRFQPKIIPKYVGVRSPWRLKDGSLLDGTKVDYSEFVHNDRLVKEIYTRSNPRKLLGEIIGYEFIPVC